MVDEIEFETYLKISPKIIGIYLCDKNNLSIVSELKESNYKNKPRLQLILKDVIA